MFVVRRPFRNYGQMLLPGSVVEPGDIKRLKMRLADRFIIEVTEQNFDVWSEYFKDKFGVLLATQPKTKDAPKAVAKDKPKVSADSKSATKPVVKVTAS